MSKQTAFPVFYYDIQLKYVDEQFMLSLVIYSDEHNIWHECLMPMQLEDNHYTRDVIFPVLAVGFRAALKNSITKAESITPQGILEAKIKIFNTIASGMYEIKQRTPNRTGKTIDRFSSPMFIYWLMAMQGWEKEAIENLKVEQLTKEMLTASQRLEVYNSYRLYEQREAFLVEYAKAIRRVKSLRHLFLDSLEEGSCQR